MTFMTMNLLFLLMGLPLMKSLSLLITRIIHSSSLLIPHFYSKKSRNPLHRALFLSPSIHLEFLFLQFSIEIECFIPSIIVSMCFRFILLFPTVKFLDSKFSNFSFQSARKISNLYEFNFY